MQKSEKNLNKKNLQDISGKIVDMFEKLNEKRQSQLNDIKEVQDKVFGLNDGLNDLWQSHLTLPNIYEQHQTLKAHLIESIYSTPEGLFDVSTTDVENEEMAIKQKIMLTDALEKMKVSDIIEKIIDNIVECGECTLFVGWNTRYKTIRRAVLNSDDENFLYEKKLIFDGADVKTIAPQDFVFDTAKASNWQSCPKIFRTYITVDELKSNKLNTLLNSKTKEALIQGALASKESENSEKGFKNGLIELLEYWGDIELEDGNVLKNYFAVVAGRQDIIRFEPNPYIECPFIYANLIENPATKRGISPLKAILALNDVATKVLNHQLDAYSLLVNPPYLAPKGAFKGVQEVAPGKIIEYDSALLPQMPTALNFSGALKGWDFVEFFKNTIENTTGIYRTMAGALAEGNRTATELNYSANGQNARLNLTIDTINRKLILPMIEKIADTIANFKFGNELVVRVLNGKKKVFEITDEIRCANYIYNYCDKKAYFERKYRQKQLMETISAFAKIEEFKDKIDWLECFKFALQNLGLENSEKYLKND